jgi:hypothetical protein
MADSMGLGSAAGREVAFVVANGGRTPLLASYDFIDIFSPQQTSDP